MRGIETQVRKIRRQIFAEVSRIGFESDDESLIHDIEAIPYKIVTEDGPQYRDSIYRARAIATERVRLAMGMCLRPTNKPVHLTDGIEASNISEKYYEPPLMQVVPSACASCEDNKYEVSDMCKGCLAHPCAEVCPKHAISMVNGHSYIDQEKCVHCGKCKSVCPYDAISKKERPCSRACGVKAIGSDEFVAKNMGINVNKYKVLAFILSGAFLGVMAILTISYGSSMVAVTGMASMSRNFVPTMGCFFGLAFKKYGMPLPAIIIGEFVINIIFFGFIALGAPTAIQDVITGLALLIIITVTTKATKGEIVK